MRPGPSLAGRAALALTLTIGFYALALGMAAALIALPIALFAYAGKVNLQLTVFCVVGGVTILWSILPRRERFTPPGPALTRDAQPELFAEIDKVAAATQQAPPAEVYLVGDVNAWVGQRGGVLGLGGRRVMGLGLPLMQALSIDSWRAVLAHEFGHYHGGDTRLGPFIYRTRAAIERTVQGVGGWLQKPFLLYARLYLRVTLAISRAQEYAADALAARLFGGPALGEGLALVNGAAPAYGAYWDNEVAPCLTRGVRPPLAPGFAAFLRVPQVAENVKLEIAEALTRSGSDPYDTHPSLPDRLRALGLPADPPPASARSPRAIELLRERERLESELLASIFGEPARDLQPIEWDEAGARVYLPELKERAEALRAALGEARLTDLPRLAARLVVAGGYVALEENPLPQPDETKAQIASHLGALVALAFVEQGFALVSEVGLPLTVRRGAEAAHPFSLAAALRDGKLDDEGWRGQLRRCGIADAPLFAPVAEAVVPL